VSDSVNPTSPRPGGGRGYGAAARPADSTAVPASAAQGAEEAGAQVSGFGRTLNRVGSAVAAGVQTASGTPRDTAARPAGAQVRVRKARLRLARVDPWSVMKVAFVLSIALGIVTLVGTAVVWEVLNGLGVFSSLNKTVGDLTSGGTGSNDFNLASVLSFARVEGYMLIVALVDIVLVTALATLGAYLYNLSAGFVGGLEVTLAEDQ
jgi:hypothetical protein